MTRATLPLSPDRLYAGDNGRVFCGAEVCAGAETVTTGRDRSGARVEAFSKAFAVGYVGVAGRLPACQGCGKVAVLEPLADDRELVVVVAPDGIEPPTCGP